MGRVAAGMIVRATAIAFACTCLVGCGVVQRYDDVPAKRVLLPPGLSSYDSVVVTSRKLAVKAGEWEVREDTRNRDSIMVPPYWMLVVRVPRRTVEGFVGDVTLQFYNDRLMKVTFYPDDYAGYVARTELPPKNGVPWQVGEFVEVYTVTDVQGRPGVVWSDIRLQKQLSRWIGWFS